MMKNVIALNRGGHLTDRQVAVASKFAQNPQKFTLAPSLYRILHDLIIHDEPLENYEERRGWSARSAKVVLAQLLFALQEVEGMWWTSKDPDEDIEDLREMIRYLTGDDSQAVCDLIGKYGLTSKEARIFLVLHAQNGPVSLETILRRAWADCAQDEIPDAALIRVFICRMRRKLRADWVIQTVWGEGYVLERVRETTHGPAAHGGDQKGSA